MGCLGWTVLRKGSRWHPGSPRPQARTVSLPQRVCELFGSGHVPIISSLYFLI